MPKFAFINLDTIQGTKIIFRKLSRNGVCFLDEFEDEIKTNPQYYSEYKTLLSYLEYYANGNKLPVTKFREIKGNKYKQSEFKSKNLRIYTISVDDGKIIIMGGYKKSQSKDLNQLDHISKELKEYYEKGRTDK